LAQIVSMPKEPFSDGNDRVVHRFFNCVAGGGETARANQKSAKNNAFAVCVH